MEKKREFSTASAAAVAEMAASTRCVHTHGPDPATGGVVVPIMPASTYAQYAPGENQGYEYARGGNPTRAVAESGIAQLEGGPDCQGMCFSSGLGALTTVMHTFPHGCEVLCNADVYGGTHRYFEQVLPGFAGIKTIFVDFTDLAAVAAAVTAKTRLFWIETPSNPLLNVVDIAGAVAVARAKDGGSTDAAKRITVVVDNTFLSPVQQSPLRLGADIVVHSVTKFIAGHCDVVMGAACTMDKALADRLRWMQNAVGAVPSPFDCYLAVRGLKTLDLRIRASTTAAMAIAKHLDTHPAVAKAIYPGLPSHPQHALAARQQSGFGGVISFYLADHADTTAFLTSLHLFALAVSLGGVESLVNYPFDMTHGALPEAYRLKIGINKKFIRLSIGIEAADDLIADLDTALAAATAAAGGPPSKKRKTG